MNVSERMTQTLTFRQVERDFKWRRGEASFVSSLSSLLGLLKGQMAGAKDLFARILVSGRERWLMSHPDPAGTGSQRGTLWLEIKLPCPLRKACWGA